MFNSNHTPKYERCQAQRPLVSDEETSIQSGKQICLVSYELQVSACHNFSLCLLPSITADCLLFSRLPRQGTLGRRKKHTTGTHRELGASGLGFLMRLTSNVWLELHSSQDSSGAGGSASRLADAVMDGPQFLTGYQDFTMQKFSPCRPHYVGFSTGLLITWQLAGAGCSRGGLWPVWPGRCP